MSIGSQVKALKEFFDPPARIRLQSHKSRNGEVASCCQAAKASIRGAVVSSAASEGMTEVIAYFTTHFSWGCLQSKHYCDCMANRDDLYCIGTTRVGLECLGFYKSISEHKLFDLMVVEFLISDCASVIRTEQQYLKEASQLETTAERSHSWVLKDVFYHVLVGLVDSQNNLMVCDSDGSMPFLAINNGSAAKIQSMRVSPWAGDTNPIRSFSHINWNGTQIALNCWVDELNIDQGTTVAVAVETLAKVYDAQRPTTLSAHPSASSLTTSFSSCVDLLVRPRDRHITNVLISGTYMGPNPCPGVGIARALRATLGDQEVRLISVGDAEFSDPVFDAHWPVLELGAAAYLTGSTKTQTQWDIVAELILTQQTEASAELGDCPVFFIPGCDTDIDLLSLGKEAVLHALNASSQPAGARMKTTDRLTNDPTWSAAQMEALNRSILCPAAATVALTAKPYIVAASCGPLGDVFKVPEFFLLNASDASGDDAPTAGVSLLEMRMFADRIGYPVLIKGAKQGALVCHSWLQLRAAITTQVWVADGAFIQSCMHGWERCIAFAAFEGRLLGSCLMTKASYTEKGKVWSGDIEPVPPTLSDALQKFVQQTNWTGGGEIEFIEEIVPNGALSFAHMPESKSTAQFMFLPRSSVPARKVNDTHDMPERIRQPVVLPSRWVVDFNPRFPAWIFASAYSGCNLPALLVAAAVETRSGSTGNKDDTPTSTTSTTSTTSSTGGSDTSGTLGNSTVAAELPLPNRVSFVRSLIEVPVVHTLHRRRLPSHAGGAHLGKEKGKEDSLLCEQVSSCNVLPYISRSILKGEYGMYGVNESFRYLAHDLRRLTTTTLSLIRADAIECTPRYILCTLTLENTLQRMQKLFAEVAAPTQLPIQLCLSVKTQPHTALIQLAAQAGYLAECIDLAEVYHAVLNGGYSFDQIVLTGPAKWWDNKSTEDRSADLVAWDQSQASSDTSQCGAAKKLNAIFADSLDDLQDILEQLLDPGKVFDTDVVGIRWVPLGDINSRFGLDSNDTETVRSAADLVRQLPESYRLGMHFHHASSVLGGERWFSLAQAFCVFSGEFAQLCGRPIATIDFGGGFEPYFLESAFAQEKLRELFQTVHHTCSQQRVSVPPTVQFELGKCISEPAGGVLTRILAIRERRSSVNSHTKDQQSAARAVIVDTTVADLSTRSTRPVFWVKKTTNDANPASKLECIALPGGPVEIWGRTCMEWDKVFGSFALPAEAKVGDYLLIAACGAYDMSMQYNFGDGVVRKDNVIVL